MRGIKTKVFGGISGTPANAFGVYRDKSGKWITGPSAKPREITAEEAVNIAIKHRDQLVQGRKILDNLPARGSDSDYLKLQEQMNELAPDVNDTA